MFTADLPTLTLTLMALTAIFCTHKLFAGFGHRHF